MNQGPKQKVRRVRTGCLTCRARKIKCDEATGGCKNCKQRQLLCDYADANSASIENTATLGTPRRLACQQCRVARSKCSHSKPRCTRCESKHLSCIYTTDQRNHETGSLTPMARVRVEKAMHQRRDTLAQRGAREGSRIPADWHESSIDTSQEDESPLSPIVARAETGAGMASTLGESISLPMNNPNAPAPARYEVLYHPYNNLRDASELPTNLLDYVDSFFDTVAPYQANGFLHRGILKQQIRDKCASETLLLAICAITARFLPMDQNGAIQATQWTQMATHRLYSSSEVKLKHAIAALILCKHASYSGAFNQAFMLAAMANRYALKIGLYDPSRWKVRGDIETSWAEAEQRRRIMFACYSVDRMTATGLRELTFCPSESLRIQLPCEDYNYDLSIPCTTPIPKLEAEDLACSELEYSAVGIMGHYVSLVGIRYLILRYIEGLSNPTTIPPWHPESDYQFAIRKLNQWSSRLPQRFKLTRENIFGRHHTPYLGPLVMLHLWHDMLHCELYRLALQSHADTYAHALFSTAPPEWTNETRDQCLFYAVRMMQTLQTLDNEVGDDNLIILDPSLAMLCFASMKIQILYATARDLMDLGGASVGMETIEGFKVLLSFTERLSKYFRHGALLLKEMKALLQSHGVVGPWSDSAISTSGTQTPDHPWLTRLKELDKPTSSNPSPSSYYGVEMFESLLSEVDISSFYMV